MDPKLLNIIDCAAKYLQGTLAPERCVNSTRVLIEVLTHFGFRASGVAVDMLCGNPAYFAAFRQLGRLPRSGELPGAYSVTTDYASPDTSIGHVVTLVGRTLAVDLASDQFSRRDHDIVLPPSVHFTVPRQWRKGGEYYCMDVGGLLVAYQARPQDRRFEKLEGYQLDMRNRTMIADVIRMAEGGPEDAR